MENGWATESYTVKTDDDYVLQLYRIPGVLGTDTNGLKKPAVLMQHGIMCDSAFWIMNSPENSPAYILAEKGYDVWLGNNRGNVFGQYHTKMTMADPAFWDFSWEEMGTYDIPAIIDFVLAKTGQSQLSYVGHSEGTT